MQGARHTLLVWLVEISVNIPTFLVRNVIYPDIYVLAEITEVFAEEVQPSDVLSVWLNTNTEEQTASGTDPQ